MTGTCNDTDDAMITSTFMDAKWLVHVMNQLMISQVHVNIPVYVRIETMT